MKKLLVLFAMLFALTANAAFPEHPVKIITAMPAGSGPDVAIRKMAEKLSEKWNVPIVVENKPGGAGAVMLSAYADAPADGYTLSIADFGVFVGYPILYKQPNALNDIQPVAGIFETPFVLATSPKVKDFADLKAKFKNNATFASSAVGTGMHLEGLELNSFWKINGSHVPYKDLGLSFVDTSNGLITYTFTTIASSRQLEQSGKLKYIAYANTTRNPDYPNLPTLAEVTGKPLTLYHSWNIVYVKKAIPADIKAKIANDVTEIMKSPALQQQLKAIGYNPLNGTPDDLEKFVNTDTTNFEKATKKYKISVE